MSSVKFSGIFREVFFRTLRDKSVHMSYWIILFYQKSTCNVMFVSYTYYHMESLIYLPLISWRFFFFFFFFSSIWGFFHEHSRFTGQQGKGEGIYLTPLYHFHPLHRHSDISRAITAEN